MHIFAAQLFTESNSFSPFPTDAAAFQAFGFWRGTASTDGANGQGAALAELRRLTESNGGRLSESICAFAQPAGPTKAEVYVALKAQILEDLQVAMPVNAVLLILHGAMIAEGFDDCEGDLLTSVRTIVGPSVPIGVTLDLHCHITASMLANADIMIAYKEYPHVDMIPRLREVFVLIWGMLNSGIRPVTCFVPCSMVGLWPTTNPAMRQLVLDMIALESDPGVLSVSLAHGFPWGDITGATAGALCITDNNPTLANATAHRIAGQFWGLRESARTKHISFADAIARGRQAPPAVIADMADNPGGGAPGDSTFALTALQEAGIAQAAFGCVCDPETVALCFAAGEGAQLKLVIGGTHGAVSGQPFCCKARIMRLIPQHIQSVKRWTSPLGSAVWLRLEPEIDVVVCNLRNQVYGQTAFTGLGIDLSGKQIIIVKSTQNFYADFKELSRNILYANSPGALTTDFGMIPFIRRSMDFWPRVQTPTGSGD
ncbi:M81 family metallopeptidase [Acerihabitans sp. TG2]|uniref:M81 family metallopeptidase n=1 Tax=Acerihabitans sp. TG2 TaxID=3096008 RepID=UPI002B23EB99|nr:M81 family metallopeptidase [Acerihabitans sp. TG2]MEA9393552.1 M81 family metallopeptidase [Acerihabitans sp. TG2]